MYNIEIRALEEFMNKLSIDTKNDKIREFLRYVGSRDTYFNEDDSSYDILKTKNVWAGYAYMVFVDKMTGKELTAREETFLNTYLNNYILNTDIEGMEKEFKGLYLKYRLSKDFPSNNVLDEHKHAIHPDFENGLEEYRITMAHMMSLIMGEDIEIVLDEANGIKSTIAYNDKTKKFVINEKYLSDAYFDFVSNNCSFTENFKEIHKLAYIIELTKLHRIRKEEISTRALIYTLEDYLYSKASKNTKVAKAYNELFNSIIKNKQIDLDAQEEAFLKLASSGWLYREAEYGSSNNLVRAYINELLISNNHARHLIRDANYIDETDTHTAAFVHLFNMYVNGLKAMPKTKLTNVTKYFVRNGNALTVLDMAIILKEYDAKILKAKDDEEKQIELEDERNQVRKVMKHIKENVPSYKIEEKVLKLVTGELTDKEKAELEEVIFNECFDNYTAFQDVKYRVSHMYSQLDNLAGSNSKSKINLIRTKERIYSSMMEDFKKVEAKIMDAIYRLGGDFQFEDASRTLVITQPDDMNKILSALQELIGRGVVTSEQMVKDSIMYGTPVLRDLSPGFKKFAEDVLASKGVKEFKKSKKKNNKK